MLQIVNKTPFNVNLCPATGLDGYDQLLVFLAVSCDWENGHWHVSEPQLDTPLSDVFFDPEKPSSIRYPSQLSHSKPSTDVIIHGHATAPGDTAVTVLPVSVMLGAREVQLVVFGERVWSRETPSAPQPFTAIPLCWENAYGGSEIINEAEYRYEHNPLGMGWRADGVADSDYHGNLMPHIEWPNELLRHPKQRPRPAGLGALAPNIPERARFAGNHDQAWLQTQAPFAPQDFNPKFFNSAIPELQFPGYLRGDESLRLEGLRPEGAIVLQLPGIQPTGSVRALDKHHVLTFTLQTVVVETDTLQVRLFWQAQAPIYRTLAEVDEIRVHFNRNQ